MAKNAISCVMWVVMCLGCSGIGKGGLEEKEQVIELSYVAFACDCANWATPVDIERYDGDSLAAHSVFIEPADTSLALPDTLGCAGDVIKFTGRFYKTKGFPQKYSSSENPDKAWVFRYTKYDVVKSNNAEVKRLLPLP